MPITTSTDDTVTTQHITGDPTRAAARVVLVAPESGINARMQLIVEGTQSDRADDIKAKLGITGEMQTHPAKPSITKYEVPKEERMAVLKSLGLSPELGGRNGVSISFTFDTGGHRSASITIEANDPKAAAFTVEQAEKMTTTLAQKKGVLPENVRAAVLKDNPGTVARVMIETAERGGTRLEFKPVDDGNLAFRIRHNPTTGADELVFPASNNPKEMQALQARVTAHLQAHGIESTGNNLSRIESVITGQAQLATVGHPSTSTDIHLRTGGLQISLPSGAGEKALEALSKPATIKIAGVTEFSKPLLAPEIARAAIPEMKETVRPVAVAEYQETQHAARAGKSFNFGNLLTKLGIGAATAGVAGLAAAAQAPEGERVETGVKVARKTAAEQMLPGVTETDTCKKVGSAVAWAGGGAGALIGGGAVVIGTGVSAVPTLGASVAASPWTTAAGVVAGGYVGSEVGSKLGEGGCNLVRAAYNAIAPENRAQIAHKPEAGKVAASPPDATSTTVPAQAKGTIAGRG